MKKWFIALLVLGLLLLPATVYAGIIFIPVTEVVFSDLGETSGERLAPGQIQVTTVGLRGSGTLRCDGDPECIAQELDGKSFAIRQDMQLVLSASEGQGIAVEGVSRGRLRLPPSAITLPDSAKFRGEVVGRARCAGEAPNPCQTLELRVRARGAVVDVASGARLGVLNEVLSGTLTLREGDTFAPAWTALAGEGTFGLSVPD